MKRYAEKNPEKLKENRARYIKNNPDYFKNLYRKNPYKKYKSLGVDIASLVKAQGGICSICKKTKPLCVDHRHDVNKFRGLLCRECNAGLGSFYDSVENLQGAIEYLKNAP